MLIHCTLNVTLIVLVPCSAIMLLRFRIEQCHSVWSRRSIIAPCRRQSYRSFLWDSPKILQLFFCLLLLRCLAFLAKLHQESIDSKDSKTVKISFRFDSLSSTFSLVRKLAENRSKYPPELIRYIFTRISSATASYRFARRIRDIETPDRSVITVEISFQSSRKQRQNSASRCRRWKAKIVEKETRKIRQSVSMDSNA